MRRFTAVIMGVIVLGAPALARADNGPIVRFATSLGNIDVRLLPQDAPQTVANFMSYVNSGAYNHSFIHRTVNQQGFGVVQGGGFTYQNGAQHQIRAQPAIQSEFLDSNVRGTLAMALSGNPANPNSGTDEWFFNTTDNSKDLDPQLFTVFGQVLDSAGLAVMDQIVNLPTDDLDTTFGGQAGGVFSAVPVQNFSNGAFTSGSFAPADLVSINSITTVNSTTPPAITVNTPTEGQQFDQGQVTLSDFSCDDGNGVGIASCTGPSSVDTKKLGPATFTVTATDYAGNTTTTVIDYYIDPPTPPPPAPNLPGLEVSGWSKSRTGAVSLSLHCRVRTGCGGTIGLAVGTRRNTVGSARFLVANGQTKQFPITLTRKGKRILSSGTGPVAAWFTVTRAGHAPIVQRASLRT
jgi:peptidyl-prolyl cis-trans isomerase A (cyclophilin A)